jgi:broad specificity phosphatase PhoE
MAEYMTRHGESEANVGGFFARHSDDPNLTEKGRVQAHGASEVLARNGITKIVSSPLSRAIQTADIISDTLDGLEVQIDDRLAEYGMGELSGMPIRRVSATDLMEVPGVEDATDFADRVSSAIFDHAQEEGDTLFVAHAGTIKIVQAILQDKEPAEFYDLRVPRNSEIVEIDTDSLREKQYSHL